MAKVKGKKLLCIVNDYRNHFGSFQGFERDEHWYKRLELGVVKNYIDKEYQNFLAQPVVKNQNIEWYANYNTPINRLSELDEEQQRKYQAIKVRTLNHYKNVVNNLQRDGKESEAAYLSNALTYVSDDRFFYCYEDKVILGIWGMRLLNKSIEPFGSAIVGFTTSMKGDLKNYTISFKIEEDGVYSKIKQVNKPENSLISADDIPKALGKEGYHFVGWNKDPKGHKVTSDIDFIGRYKKSLPTPEPIKTYTVTFKTEQEDGEITVEKVFDKPENSVITSEEVPLIDDKEGHEFTGWNQNPSGHIVTDNVEFIAQYRETAPPPPPTPPSIPWYKKLWQWFTGNGCLKWLLWILFILLAIFLFSWLLNNCEGNRKNPISNGESEVVVGEGNGELDRNDRPYDYPNDETRESDSRESHGIYNPDNPYTSRPTPPEYRKVLPPREGVIEPIEDSEIIVSPTPDRRRIVGNRLNILLKDEDKSVMDFAKDFKQHYSSNQYQVVYYDDVVKRLQIEVPASERIHLKEEIMQVFGGEYDLFIFDESLFQSRYIPNDPAFKDAKNTWFLEAINVSQAWDITTGNDDIVIAIVDNGFDLRHKEFEGKVTKPYNVWSKSNQVTPFKIDHGTHVAGIAIANINNQFGLSGIAPNAKFMPVQVANANNMMTTTSVLDGILYAIYQGADVVNISLGQEFDFAQEVPEELQLELQNNYFKEEERLWNEVMDISNKRNVTIVIAAGNENILAGMEPINRPDNFIIVSAVDKNYTQIGKARFSNYGTYSTISAPGVEIFSTVGNNKFERMSGTSMAAPMVAGTVALMKSLNENLTTKQIIRILQSTGEEMQGSIGKLIQVDKALRAIDNDSNLNEDPNLNSRLIFLRQEKERLERELRRVNEEIKQIETNK